MKTFFQFESHISRWRVIGSCERQEMICSPSEARQSGGEEECKEEKFHFIHNFVLSTVDQKSA
jgi:hypothetical protein